MTEGFVVPLITRCPLFGQTTVEENTVHLCGGPWEVSSAIVGGSSDGCAAIVMFCTL